MNASKAYENIEEDKDGGKWEKVFDIFCLKHISQASGFSDVFLKLVGSSCCQSSLFIFFFSTQFLSEWGSLVISSEDKLSGFLFLKYSFVVNSRPSGKEKKILFNSATQNEKLRNKMAHVPLLMPQAIFYIYSNTSKQSMTFYFPPFKGNFNTRVYTPPHTHPKAHRTCQMSYFPSNCPFKHHKLWSKSTLTEYVMFKTDVLLMCFWVLSGSDYVGMGGYFLSQVYC